MLNVIMLSVLRLKVMAPNLHRGLLIALALPANNNRLKRLVSDKHSSLFWPHVSK
jgi:hypothetical protein